MGLEIPEGILFTPKEVAKIFRVKVRTVYAWYAEGKVEGVKLSPSCLRFSRAELVKFVEKKRMATIANRGSIRIDNPTGP